MGCLQNTDEAQDQHAGRQTSRNSSRTKEFSQAKSLVHEIECERYKHALSGLKYEQIVDNLHLTMDS